MEIQEIIKALRRNMVESGSLICLGCGREHNCSTHGCAIMREAANALEKLLAEKKDTDAHLKAISDGLSGCIRRAAPKNKLDLSEIDRVIHLYESATECPCDTYAQLILAALYEYKDRHAESKPLTLEQLRQMDGEPVWLHWIGNLSDREDCWAIVHMIHPQGTLWDLGDYGKTWLAYTHKLEGSET